MGQSFKFLSCLSSEACTGYHCMLQGRGRRSVIRASQCTEHWVSASQNVSVAFKGIVTTFLTSFREGKGDLAPWLRQQQVPGGHYQAGWAGSAGHQGS